MIKSAKTKIYVKTFILMAVVCIVIICLISAVYLDKVRGQEGNIFIQNVDSMQLCFELWFENISYSELSMVVSQAKMDNVAFSIRDEEGGLIWTDKYDTVFSFEEVNYNSDLMENINLFNKAVENYYSGNENYYSGNDDGADSSSFKGVHDYGYYSNLRGLMKCDYLCVRPIAIFKDGNKAQYWSVYSKTADLLRIYGKSFLWIGIFCIILFLITGMILARGSYKAWYLKAREEERRRLLTNSLAHDLKTPITTICAYSDLLKEDINRDKRNFYIDMIRESSEKLNESLQSMLKLSSLYSENNNLNLEEVRLKELTAKVLDRFEIEPAFECLTVIGEECTITVDRELFSKALENFISNAFKNLSTNGRIIIETGTKKWSIFNTGEHIKSENLSKIWDAWFMEDESRNKNKGSGLGLYIVKTILDAHGFAYSVENVEEGVKFSIFLG